MSASWWPRAEALPALGLEVIGFAGGDLPELPDERGAVDEKRPAGLVASEAVHDADGGAAVEAKQFLQHRAVNDRRSDLLQSFQSGWNLLQPFSLAG
jgi:hypothetical protein